MATIAEVEDDKDSVVDWPDRIYYYSKTPEEVEQMNLLGQAFLEEQ